MKRNCPLPTYTFSYRDLLIQRLAVKLLSTPIHIVQDFLFTHPFCSQIVVKELHDSKCVLLPASSCPICVVKTLL